MNECNAPEADDIERDPQAGSQIPLQRKRGEQAPPFAAGNADAMALLLVVFEAAVGSRVPRIEISERVGRTADPVCGVCEDRTTVQCRECVGMHVCAACIAQAGPADCGAKRG